jgi:hypothetical protein
MNVLMASVEIISSVLILSGVINVVVMKDIKRIAK